MDEKVYCVYIMTNKKDGTLYTGVSNNLARRVYEHKNGLVDGFTKKYCLHRLVYYEPYNDPAGAIFREKQMKKWYRHWKIELIEKRNSEWKDLYSEIV
ncbi:MAG: GIY-YIG nuclease family protein [Candidatus Omnitrophota bacterium]|nr:GIY-YIG nuclease family protein [Candidatus Omnitrophota bacterium]